MPATFPYPARYRTGDGQFPMSDRFFLCDHKLRGALLHGRRPFARTSPTWSAVLR
jgi:hypothetical protein